MNEADDIMVISGQTEKLAVILQNRYEYDRNTAEQKYKGVIPGLRK